MDINTLNVLVVDDYEIMREGLCKVLTQLGSTTFKAANGVEALEVIRNTGIDLVFTDLVMPEMDGFELCEEIRKSSKYHKLPIVAVSTHCDSNYIVKALRNGATDYIVKPAKIDIVKRVLNRIFTPTLREDY